MAGAADSSTRSLTVPVALGMVAGWIDGVCFTHLVEVFPANQSGNLILFGVGVGGAPAPDLGASATAMVAFVAGVLAAAFLRRAARLRARGLLAIEAALVAGAAVAVGPIEGRHQLVGIGGLLVLAALSVAMGVQTEVVRSRAGEALSTTYQTGGMTRLAEHLADGATGGGSERSAQWRGAGVLGSVIAGYVAGAAAGAWVGDRWTAALAVPVVGLAVLAATARRWARPS